MEQKELTTAAKTAAISAKWLEDMMSDYGLKQVDLVRECGINKMQLSQFLGGKKDLPPSRKYALHYFFLYLDAQRQIRLLAMGNENEY